MENTKQVSVKNCIKYIVFAGVIYTVLKVVPTTQLSNIEISVLICVILLGIFSLDCLTSSNKKKEKMTNAKMFDLDLDIDLDFNKKSKLTETASDVKSKLSETSVTSEKGINMEEVKKELSKKNSALSEESAKEKKEDDAIVQKQKEKVAEKAAAEKAAAEKAAAKKAAAKKAAVENKKSSGINCEVEVSKMRRDMENRIRKLQEELRTRTNKSNSSKFGKKYLSVLIADLLDKKIIDKNDIENINAKLISGTSSLEEVLQSLEKLRSIGVAKKVSDPKDRSNDMKYSDLPASSYKSLGGEISNEWTNEFTILNTDKWQVSQPRPPVCISNTPCKVCPTNTEGYPASLKEWDSSRVITNNKINKKWALDQADSKTN